MANGNVKYRCYCKGNVCSGSTPEQVMDNCKVPEIMQNSTNRQDKVICNYVNNNIFARQNSL